LAVAAVLLPGRLVGAGLVQSAASADALLEAAGARVERFFTRAETLMCIETVVMQPLGMGLSPGGFTRTVESELRLSWAPGENGAATEAQVERKVLRVNGRTPRENDRGRCTTPEQEATETQPLSMLLPGQRERFAFSIAGRVELDGRTATTVDFRELGTVSTDVRAVDGVEGCVSWNFTGGRQGRLWIDQATADVLRLDQHLTAMIDLPLPDALRRAPTASRSWTLERSDTTIRFARVAFSDPDETIVLPREAVELRVMRGGGEPRLRTVTTYSDYKRFLTSGRLVTATREE
jgi:hypothetical protein